MTEVKVPRIRFLWLFGNRPTGRLVASVLVSLVALGGWGFLVLHLIRDHSLERTAKDTGSATETVAAIARDLVPAERVQAPNAPQSSSRTQPNRKVATNPDDQDTMQQLRAENAKLRSRLALFNQLVGSHDGTIAISDLALATKGANDARYWFRVSRIDGGDFIVTGAVQMEVRGMLNGQMRTLELGELTDHGIESHQFRFQHFQEIDGSIKLPLGFVPEYLLVTVVPEDSSISGAQREFDWCLNCSTR